MSDAAVLLRGLVGAKALSTGQVGVRTVGLKMSLESITCHFYFLACGARNLLLRASSAVIGLLGDLEGLATTAVRALNNPELAIIEHVLRVVFVRDTLRLACIVATAETSSIKHSLFDGMQLRDGLAGLLAVLADGILPLLGRHLAGSTDQLVALVAVTSFDSCKVAIGADRRLQEHGVRATVQCLETALELGPVRLVRNGFHFS